MTAETATTPALLRPATPHPAAALVVPPTATRAMHAPHARPPLDPGARTDTVWIWLLATVPWALASTIFFFDIAAVLDALWVGDESGAIAHVALHGALLVGSSLATIGLALLFAARDARHLRGLGLIRPFPWGFAAIAGLIYLIGRTVVLTNVTRPPRGALATSAALYLAYYVAFGLWASITLANALQSIASAI